MKGITSPEEPQARARGALVQKTSIRAGAEDEKGRREQPEARVDHVLADPLRPV
jgi:hypothetical protein